MNQSIDQIEDYNMKGNHSKVDLGVKLKKITR